MADSAMISDKAIPEEREILFEKNLTATDLQNGVYVPAKWAEDNIPEGREIFQIEFKDEVVPAKICNFQFHNPMSWSAGKYKIVKDSEWDRFALNRKLQVGDKIVAEAVRKLDLNVSSDQFITNGYIREKTIKALRSNHNGGWADIRPRDYGEENDGAWGSSISLKHIPRT